MLLPTHYQHDQMKVGDAELTGEKRSFYKALQENLKKRDCLQYIGVDERILLKWVFSKCAGGHKMEWSDSGQGQVGFYCECGDEISGSVNADNFLTS